MATVLRMTRDELHPLTIDDLSQLRLPLHLAVLLTDAVARGVKIRWGTGDESGWYIVAPVRGAHAAEMRRAGARSRKRHGAPVLVLDERPQDFCMGVGLGDAGSGRKQISELVSDAYQDAVVAGKAREAWKRLQRVRLLLRDARVTWRNFQRNPEGWLEELWDYLAATENERVLAYLDALDAAGA